MNQFQPAPVAQRGDPEERRIKIHDSADFVGMRKAGRLAAEVLDFITPHVKPGVSTDWLDKLCHGFIVDHGAIPAPLNYRGFRDQSAPRSTTSSATAFRARSGSRKATFSISTSPSSSMAGMAIRAACISSASASP